MQSIKETHTKCSRNPWTVISPMSRNFSKNGQKSDSFVAHHYNHFKPTASHSVLRMPTTFNVVKQINPIGPLKEITNLIVIYV